MAKYIDQDAAIKACYDGFADCRDDCAANIRNIPAADVVERKTEKTMYEGLVQNLRSVDENDTGYAKLIYDAADVIEKLAKEKEFLSEQVAHWQSETVKTDCEVWIAENGKPDWMPVERLPQKENRTYWICTDTGYQCECRWTNNRFGIGESDEWGWSIADVPQYHKVVAWMFLPKPYEPPKEET